MGWDRNSGGRVAGARRRRGCGRDVLGLVVAVVIIVVIAITLTPVSQFILAPWSMGLNGSPTMTGTRVGSLRSEWGGEYHLYLDLHWDPPGRRTRNSRRGMSRADLTGSARICNRAGKEFELDVDGGADRSASDVDIYLEASGSQHGERMTLQGRWDGEALRLSTFTSIFGPEGELRGARSIVTSTTSDASGRVVTLYPTDLRPDQVPGDSFPEVILRKDGDAEYRAGCRALRG